MAEHSYEAPSDKTTSAAGQSRLRLRFTWLTDHRLAGAFLTPTMVLLLLMNIFPLIWSLYLSFTNYNVNENPDWTSANWIGLENYADLLADPTFWERFTVTAVFVIPTVAVEFVLGFGIALLLNRKFAGRGLITTLILIPMMLTTVVVGLFWRFLFHAEFGILNYVIHNLLGLDRILWLTETTPARIALIITDVWQWTPFVMLIALAGLSAVPKYLYEAADVDRASGWFKFRHITLPLISPLLIIAVVFRLMDTYKLFDLAWVLTGGGPGDTTKSLPIYLYKESFGSFDTGRASAAGYIMLIVIIALANLLIRLLNQQQAEG